MSRLKSSILVRLPRGISLSDPQTTDFIKYHGIGGLFSELGSDVPTHVLGQARAQAMWEMRHRLELLKLLEQFSASGIDHALMKGTALAYSLYSSPHLRSRGDTDILVPRSHLNEARRILNSLGYSLDPSAFGNELTDHQESWIKTTPDRALHTIDLHWAVMNGAALADIFPVEECLACAEDLPALSPSARTLSKAHNLAHACLHRLMHRTAPYLVGDRAYLGADRLIWAVDIRLLCEALTESDRQEVISLAGRHGVAGPILDGVRFAELETGLVADPAFLEALTKIDPNPEMDRYFLRLGRRGRAWANLQASGNWAQIVRKGFRMALPPLSAIRAQHPNAGIWSLLALYVRRSVSFALGQSGTK